MLTLTITSKVANNVAPATIIPTSAPTLRPPPPPPSLSSLSPELCDTAANHDNSDELIVPVQLKLIEYRSIDKRTI